MIKAIYYLALFAILLIPNIVNADCSYEENVRLQKLANNINFSYDYEEFFYEDDNYKSIKFSITISNLVKDLYIYDNRSGKKYYFNDKEILIDEISNGTTREFIIYSDADSCRGDYVMSKYVIIPPYNYYYASDLCKDIESYYLCKRWTNNNLSEEEFISKINKYIEGLDDNVEPEIDEEKETLFERILYFLSKYNLPIFGSIIIITTTLLVYLKNKNDFDLK